MSRTEEPPRLKEGSDALGRLLRLESSLELSKGRDDFPDLLCEHKRRRRQRGSLALAAACFVLGLVFVSTHTETPEEPLAISAEPLVVPSGKNQRHITAPHPPSEPRPLHTDGDQERHEQPSAKRASSTAPKARAQRASPPVSQYASPDPVAPDCPALTQAGKYADAVTCYAEQARSSGVSAELALLEKARLESRVFGDETAALASLDEYQARFPTGALFREATLARIEALDALGRASEALRTVEGALQRIPEKAGQLSLLAARLAAQAGDCAAAARHLDSARTHGEGRLDLARYNPTCAPPATSHDLLQR